LGVFIAIAIVVGILAGMARGGRFANLGDATFRLWPLLILGVVVQGAAAFTGDGAVVVILVSYVLLLAFCAVNLTHAGMGVVLVGIALNLVVIGLNGGMPVRQKAIVAAGIADQDEVASLDFGAKRHLEDGADRLTFLGDIIPVPFAGEVLSYGDLAMSVGVAAVLANLLRSRRSAAVVRGVASVGVVTRVGVIAGGDHREDAAGGVGVGDEGGPTVVEGDEGDGGSALQPARVLDDDGGERVDHPRLDDVVEGAADAHDGGVELGGGRSGVLAPFDERGDIVEEAGLAQ
jgi:hypothetical protein